MLYSLWKLLYFWLSSQIFFEEFELRQRESTGEQHQKEQK